MSGPPSGTTMRGRTPPRAGADRTTSADAALSRRFAYGFSALVGFVLGNALYSVTRHRSLAGALLLLITVLGGLLLLIANKETVTKRGFCAEAVDRSVAIGTFAVLLFTGVICNAYLFD